MKKVLVDFPVLAWASVEIEVDDDLTSDDVYDGILNDEIDVPFSPEDLQSVTPVLSIRNFDFSMSEIPQEFEVVE